MMGNVAWVKWHLPGSNPGPRTKAILRRPMASLAITSIVNHLQHEKNIRTSTFSCLSNLNMLTKKTFWSLFCTNQNFHIKYIWEHNKP